MKLYFVNSSGDKRLIKNCLNNDDVENTILDFCNERGYIIPYWRTWDCDFVRTFDVGSHTEFFELELSEEKDDDL